MNPASLFKNYETNQKVFDRLCKSIERVEKTLFTLTRMRDSACCGVFIGMEVVYNGVKFEVVDILHKPDDIHMLRLLEVREDEQPLKHMEVKLDGYMKDVNDLLEIIK